MLGHSSRNAECLSRLPQSIPCGDPPWDGNGALPCLLAFVGLLGFDWVVPSTVFPRAAKALGIIAGIGPWGSSCAAVVGAGWPERLPSLFPITEAGDRDLSSVCARDWVPSPAERGLGPSRREIIVYSADKRRATLKPQAARYYPALLNGPGLQEQNLGNSRLPGPGNRLPRDDAHCGDEKEVSKRRGEEHERKNKGGHPESAQTWYIYIYIRKRLVSHRLASTPSRSWPRSSVSVLTRPFPEAKPSPYLSLFFSWYASIMYRTLASVALLAGGAAAHGAVTSYNIAGKDYPG